MHFRLHYNRVIKIISFKIVNSLGYKLWHNRYGHVSITRHQWLGKTTKRVLIKSYRRPIKVPQNAFIVLMIYEKKIQQWSITMHQLHVEKQCWYIGPWHRIFPQGWLTESLSQRHNHDYTYITNWAAKCIFKFHWTNPTISKVKNINLHEISVNIIRGVIFVIKNSDIAWFR